MDQITNVCLQNFSKDKQFGKIISTKNFIECDNLKGGGLDNDHWPPSYQSTLRS